MGYKEINAIILFHFTKYAINLAFSAVSLCCKMALLLLCWMEDNNVPRNRWESKLTLRFAGFCVLYFL